MDVWSLIRPDERLDDLVAPEFDDRLPKLSESFANQWDYETSTELYNAVCCSRRAGKTTGAFRRHARVLATAPPGSWTHFGSLIRRNARKHFWNPLKHELDRLGWKYAANNTEMILALENGNHCQAFGCDDASGTKAVQGDGSVLFTVDECHLPNDEVLQLLVDVATPMLTDRGGMLDLLGLPPEVEGGFFDNALTSGGFRVFGWTMFDHDFPTPREEKLARVEAIARGRGLSMEVTITEGADGRPRIRPVVAKTHPIILRQYFGWRVADPEKRAYSYSRGLNEYDPVTVDFTGPEWRTVGGLDLGWSDHDALVIGSRIEDDPSRKVRVRYQWRLSHTDAFDLTDIMQCAREVFGPFAVVGDHGGHGAQTVMATVERVLKTNIGRKPGDVMVSVGFVNDDLRTGRLLLPTQDLYTEAMKAAARKLLAGDPERMERVVTALEGCECEKCRKANPGIPGPIRADIRKEINLVSKSVDPKTHRVVINKRGFHSDLTEAMRYMHSGMVRAPIPAPDVPLTDPQALRELQIREQIAKWERQKTRGRWGGR